MSRFPRRPRKKNRIKRNLLITIVLIIILYNIGNIGRAFYPIQYKDIIFSEARNNGMDPFLMAAIVKTESNFNNLAVSPKGARGLMQIMPDTGSWVAKQGGIPDYSPARLFEPAYNIRIGGWYLADLNEEFNGNTILVLAAYNGGRGNVKKWISREDWNIQSQNLDQIPFPETRQFVRKVLWYQKVYTYLYSKQ